jgi:AraC-like DNA-binding protein
MYNGSTPHVLLAYGFPQRHQLMLELMPHAEIIEHSIPDCALAAAVSQSATGALLCSTVDPDNLLTMAGRWYAHPSTKHKPLILLGCDAWKLEDVQLANHITADSYLPSTITVPVLLESIVAVSKRIGTLLDKDTVTSSILIPFNSKIELMLREQATIQSSSIRDMAHEVGMSISRFQRTVKRMTGRSPIDYINYVRLTKARQLLVSRSGTVSDVAYQCGFNSVAYFCKQFKREFGQTPGDTML